MSKLILTTDQEQALLQIKAFIFNENQKEFILSGNSGSGKSTLVKYIVDHLASFLKPLAALKGYEVIMTPQLTATTNEAATVLSNATGLEAKTVHSFFKFRFKKNFKTGELDLITKDGNHFENTLLCVDEASMLNQEMRIKINEHMGRGCKILYVGDNEQLDSINSICDVFTSGLPHAHLTTNVRQAGNEIAALGLLFRDAVINGVLPTLSYLDSGYIKYVNGQEFQDLVEDRFAIDNYMPDRKIVAFTNDRVNEYNDYIRISQNGHDGYREGEWLTANNTITNDNNIVAKNNSDVCVTDISHGTLLGLDGYIMTVCGSSVMKGIIPDDKKAAKRAINKLAKNKQWSDMFSLQDKILDLRPRFASTIYKAQGGTFDVIYIDLNDISRCRDKKKIARLMYVAITRAKSKVYLYGKL